MFKKYFIFLFWILVATCRVFSCSTQTLTLSCGKLDLAPQPRIEPPAFLIWECGSLSHWTTRGVLIVEFCQLLFNASIENHVLLSCILLIWYINWFMILNQSCIHYHLSLGFFYFGRIFTKELTFGFIDFSL